MCSFFFLIGCFLFGLCFSLVGFHHRSLSFVWLADFGFMFLGGHFVAGVGDLSFGPFGCGP